MAILCNTPSIRTPLSGLSGSTQWRNTRAPSSHFINGHQFRNRPIKNMIRLLLMIFLQNTASPAASSLGITNDIALPTANKKKGNTRSVGVNPCQGACLRGGKVCVRLPGLFTNIMRQTVAPRKTSSE